MTCYREPASLRAEPCNDNLPLRLGVDAASVYEEGLYLPIMKCAERGIVDQTLIRIVRGNAREPDQLIGDIYALATCNAISHRRLIDMMQEFGLADLNGIAAFILDNSRRAT